MTVTYLPNLSPASLDALLPGRIQCFHPIDFDTPPTGPTGPPGGSDPIITAVNYYHQTPFLMIRQESRGHYPSVGLLTSVLETTDRTRYYCFFSYLCTFCQTLFPVPSWVRQPDDLTRALQHSCHRKETSEEETFRQLQSSAEATATSILSRIELQRGRLSDNLPWVASLIRSEIIKSNIELWRELQQQLLDQRKRSVQLSVTTPEPERGE